MTKAHTKLPGASLLAYRSRRWVAFVAAVFLLTSQVIVQQHVHAEDASSNDCVMCVHSDHTPIAATAPGLAVPQGVEAWTPTPQCLAQPRRILLSQHARAPPAS